jgi:cytochrome c-type biogenesis protein CcmH/NrfG
LLLVKFEKTRNKQDEDAAFQAYDKAISLDPKNASGSTLTFLSPV